MRCHEMPSQQPTDAKRHDDFAIMQTYRPSHTWYIVIQMGLVNHGHINLTNEMTESHREKDSSMWRASGC